MWADRHRGQIGALNTAAAAHSGHGQGIEARIILEAAQAQLSSTRRTAAVAVAEYCNTASLNPDQDFLVKNHVNNLR